MLRNLLIITCLLCTTTITFGQKNKKEKGDNKTDYKVAGAPMPPIRLVTQDGKVYTTKDLKNKANLLVMLFNPTCEHCHDATLMLEKNIHLFNKSKLVLMASKEVVSYMDYFKNSTKYPQYPSMIVGIDSADFITHTFRYQSLPQINVYDSKRKLIRIFNGDTPIDSLKQYIE